MGLVYRSIIAKSAVTPHPKHPGYGSAGWHFNASRGLRKFVRTKYWQRIRCGAWHPAAPRVGQSMDL